MLGLFEFMNTLNDLCINYKKYLEAEASFHYDAFCNRLQSNPESAHGEAVVFSYLNSNRFKVKNFEDPAKGGPDFICEGYSRQFIVEVTSLDSNAVENHSGIPNRIPDGIEAHSFNAINHLLKRKATEKTTQVAGLELPRVLAITIEHVHSGVLFTTDMIQNLMTGDTKISVPLNDPDAISKETTSLDNSVFFKFSKEDGKIVPCRQSISAIITLEIFNNECRVLGMLHPDPAVKFSPGFLPTTPFLKLVEWPIKENKIFTEWIIYDPESTNFYYTYIYK